MKSRLLNKYWRLLIGLGFACAGLSAFQSNQKGALLTLLISLLFIGWHAVFLLLKVRQEKKTQ